MKSASLIYTKPNQWRANTITKDWHFIYVIKGEFEYYFKTNVDEKINKKIVTEGQLLQDQ